MHLQYVQDAQQRTTWKKKHDYLTMYKRYAG